MKFISWNVNGIRAVIKKGFYDFVNEHNPDILCIQETKAHKDQVDLQLENYPYKYWNSAVKKGYSSTAIFSKIKPIDVANDMGIKEHDSEGRVITMQLDKYYLVTVYTPNAKRELLRLDYRKKWDKDFLSFCIESENKKPTIITGDLNVAHREIDIARPKPNYNKSAGYTQVEIDGLDNFLNNNFIDIYRKKYPDKIKYSWWNYRFKSRDRNVGWRIDYFLVSPSILNNLKNTEIHNEYFGSDHCPVSLELSF